MVSLHDHGRLRCTMGCYVLILLPLSMQGKILMENTLPVLKFLMTEHDSLSLPRPVSLNCERIDECILYNVKCH